MPTDAAGIPGPHPRGYARLDQEVPLTDLTAINPSVAGASGSMISSASDLDRFLGSLVGGWLLRPAHLREMMRTRPTGSPDGSAYGLGLQSDPLPCGGRYSGRDGGILGYQAPGGATIDGRRRSW